MAYGWYVYGETFLYRATPLGKLSMMLLLWVALFVYYSPWWDLLVFAVILSMILAARIPFRNMMAFVKIIVPVMGIFMILFPLLEHGGQTLFRFSVLNITTGGIYAGIIGATRLGGLFFSIIGILLSTTKEIDLVKALAKIGLPVGPALLLMISLRSISMSMEDIEIIRDSRKARALPEKENAFQFIRNIVSLILPLFVTTIKRIHTQSQALQVKGFDPKKKLTTLKSKLTRGEMVAPAVYLVLIALLIFIRFYTPTLI